MLYYGIGKGESVMNSEYFLQFLKENVSTHLIDLSQTLPGFPGIHILIDSISIARETGGCLPVFGRLCR